VKVRAIRVANIVASVPVETNRTCSAQGTAATTASASRTDGSDSQKKVEPRATCAWTAFTMAGCAWPRSSGPDPRT
jgi:hypothetical protein